MAADSDFTLDPTARASRHLVGHEQEPVLMLDGLKRRPEALVDYAANEVGFAPAGYLQGGYPGVRALAPLDYVQSVVKAMDPLVRQAFGLDRVRLARAECNFSIVTTAPDALKPWQRIPHVDTSTRFSSPFSIISATSGSGGPPSTATARRASNG